MTVDVQMWASTASILAVALAGFGMLIRKIDGVERRLDSRIDREVGGLRTDIARLDGRIDKLETRVEDGLAKLDERVEDGLAKLDARIDSLANRMDAGFARIQIQLTAVEQRTFDLAARSRG